MATFTGSAGGGGRKPYLDVTLVSRSASSAVVRFVFRSNPVSGYSTWGTFSGTLKVNGTSYAISGGVTSGAANNIWSRDITFNGAGAMSLACSVTGSIAGAGYWTSTSLSGTFNVAAGAAKPGAPSNLTMTRTGVNSASYSWTKGSNTTTTRIQLNTNGGDYTWTATSTGSSHTITGMGSNNSRRVRMRSEGAGGNSAWVYGPTFYGKPLTPTTPTLDGAKVSWTLPSRYKAVVEVARSNDNGNTTATTVTLGEGVTTWTDPVAQLPLTRYRVRVNADPSLDEEAWSDWSDWSKSAMAATYKPPQITAMTARRCNSAGVLTETGRYLRVTTSGTVSKVPNASNTETNTLTRKIGYRKKGATAWTETTVLNGGAPNNWANAGITIGSNLIAETDVWEVRATVQDAYSGLIVQQVTVPVSQVALSLAGAGIGAGKTWEQGALDVGGDAHVEGSLHLADPNEIVINGQAYQRTGRMGVTRPALSAVAGGYAATWDIDPPYVPPEGWGFQAHTPVTNGYGFVFFTSGGQLTAGRLTLRFWGNSSGTTLTTIGWTLVKYS